MRRFILSLVLCSASLLILFGGVARAEPQWLSLPPTPSLPSPATSGYAEANGARIW
jgi:hypothetical protein